MKKYLELSLMMITSLIVSCAGDCFSPGGPGGWGPMMMYNGYGYGGMFMGIIFLIVIVALAYFIVQTLKTKGQPPTQNESPMDILKRRYAKGEITREEFEKMKKDLES
jgi:putative membrane protein